MDDFIFRFISTWIAIIVTALFVYVCTQWVLNVFVFGPNVGDSTSLTISRSVTISNSGLGFGVFRNNHILSQKQSLSIKSISETGMSLKLYQLLASNEGLNCFMNHLICEFSHECLLSFIEMVQWKTRLNQIIIDNLDIFEHENIEQIIIINQYLKKLTIEKNMNASHDLIKKYSVELSRGVYNYPICGNINGLNNGNNGLLSPKNSNASIPSMNALTDDKSNLNYKLHIILFQFPDKVPLSSIVADTKYNGSYSFNFEKESQPTDNISNMGYIDDRDALDKLRDADDEMDEDESKDMDESILRHETKIIYDFKMKAYALFRRYINNRNGCDMEINIKYGTRNRLINLLDNLDCWMMNDIEIMSFYELFDDCIQEMYRLMKDSFKRFKQTEQFNKLDKAIFSSIKREY